MRQRRLGYRLADSGQPRIRPGPAQAPTVQLARAGAECGAVLSQGREGMFQQRQQRHRRKARLHRVRQQAQERARRRMRQGPAGGIVNRHAPARHLCRDPSRQVAVRRHQCGGAARRFQRFTQRQRNRQRLLRRIGGSHQGEIAQAFANFPAAAFHQRAPGVRRRRRPQAFAQQGFARGIYRNLEPVAHIGAIRLHGLQQLPQAELRMTRIQIVPAFGVQPAVQSRQHHMTLRQPRNRAQQSCRGGDRAGGTGSDYQPRRRCRFQPQRQGFQGACPPRGRIQRALFVQNARPYRVQHIQEARHAFPMLCQLRRGQGRKLAKVRALGLNLVHHLRQAVGQCRRLRKRQRAVTTLGVPFPDQPRQQQLPPQRRNGGHQIQPLRRGIEQQVVFLAVAQRLELGQQHRAAHHFCKGLAKAARRAPGGQIDGGR